MNSFIPAPPNGHYIASSNNYSAIIRLVNALAKDTYQSSEDYGSNLHCFLVLCSSGLSLKHFANLGAFHIKEPPQAIKTIGKLYVDKPAYKQQGKHRCQ
jgi:hypothetical protein